MNRKLLLNISGIIIIGLVMGLGILHFLGSDKTNVAASYEKPLSAEVGTEFNLDIRLNNTTNATQEIVGFGIESQLLEQGINVVSSIPNFRSSEARARWVDYDFSLRNRVILDADAEDLFRITLRAEHAGEFHGEIAIWYKNQVQAQYISVIFRVTSPADTWLGG